MNKSRSIQDVFIVIMRITVTQALIMVIMTSLVFAAELNGQGILDRKVSIDVDDIDVRSILNEIEKQTSVTFTYRPATVQASKRVSLHVKEAKISEVLRDLFGSKLESIIVEEEILLRASSEPSPVYNTSSKSYTGETVFTVSGKITDETGEPLPGVNILEKGTTNGAVSDTEGKYTLNVLNETSTLVYSFIGFQSQEIAVSSRSVIDISLNPDIQSLSEVVVVGYNTQQKRDIVGSIATVDEAQLKAFPANNFAQQLQGRAAGVNVGSDNSPGGGVSVRIRGVGSVTGVNDPLYVIDGVPTLGNLNQINPNDIETIQILKDASTASVYGARANNGVVVITTKKGKAGATKVSYSMYEGVQDPGKGPDLLNSQQYADVIWADYRSRGQMNPDGTLTTPDIVFGGGVSPVIPDYIFSSLAGVNNGQTVLGTVVSDANVMDFYSSDWRDAAVFNKTKFLIYRPSKQGTDWYDVMFRNAPIRNHNVTVSGGSEGGRFAISADYFEQQGVLIFNSFKRYSLRANTEFAIKKHVRIGENLQLSYSDGIGYINARTEFSPIIGYRTTPLQPISDIAGNPIGHRLGEDNGYIDAVRNQDNHDYTSLIFGNLYAEVDILKDFTFRTSGGFDYKNFNSQAFLPLANESDFEPTSSAANMAFATNYALNLTWTNTLNYQKSFGDHNLQILLGTEAITQKFRDISGQKNTYAFEFPSYQYLSAGSQINFLNGGGIESSLFSLFGKIDYKFRNRYLLSATVRRDASSRFASSNRWGTFPALGAGWIISEEEFLKSVDAISMLKLRVGWGITGNQEIDPYNQYSTFAISNITSSYPITGANSGAANLYPGIEARKFGNPDAQWEEQSMLNIGIDIGLFDNLEFTAEWYERQTSKLLLTAPAISTGGQTAVPAKNVGEVENKGVDLSLTYKGIANDFHYSIGVNWSTYKNEVTRLYDASAPFINGLDISRQQVFTRTVVGLPISSFYGMVCEGVFHSQEEADSYPTQFSDRSIYNQPGRLKFADVNDDGIINQDDVTFIGNSQPDFTYGVNLSGGYKGFDATLFLMGVVGNDIYNFQRQTLELMGFAANKSIRILDHWSPENSEGNVPTPNILASANEIRTSSYFIEKGTYLRAKTFQVGYTFPNTMLSKVGIDRLRLYMQASNLFTITDYKGLDPEVNVQSYGNARTDLDRGVDRGIYPAAKTYMVGLQLGF